MNYNWKLGSQRVRDPSKVTVELLATDMGGKRPLLGRYKDVGHDTYIVYSEIWDPIQFLANGRSHPDKDSPWDLMPPLMTRIEVLKACAEKYHSVHGNDIASIGEAIDHYDMLRREGRVEE